ncbi:recombinase family protein [Nonomuraea zeae]|uniref:recombinase family protein n=1 Tax=Nonomuraea zeae TaxID=1642303 RepID=UPI001F0D6F38|nr:recombinase family protein [Nonomuraea zeae]
MYEDGAILINGPLPEQDRNQCTKAESILKWLKLLRVSTPADRGPGQPWRPGTPVPPAVAPDSASADIRIGYARCSTLTQELQSQLDALAAHGIPREKTFAEKISSRVRVRPQFEAALALARQIKAHAPHCRVIVTVYEMKRLGRDDIVILGSSALPAGQDVMILSGPLVSLGVCCLVARGRLREIASGVRHARQQDPAGQALSSTTLSRPSLRAGPGRCWSRRRQRGSDGDEACARAEEVGDD